MKASKLTLLALSVSLAMILSFVESQIPAMVAIPGVKVGLANIVVVFLLYKLGWNYAAVVSGTRVFLVGLLFGNGGHRGGLYPAHVFSEDLPAEHDGDSEDNSENEATVIHDVPESLLSQRDERWKGGAQDRIRPDCPGGSAGCAENRATGPLWGHVPR